MNATLRLWCRPCQLEGRDRLATHERHPLVNLRYKFSRAKVQGEFLCTICAQLALDNPDWTKPVPIPLTQEQKEAKAMLQHFHRWPLDTADM
jgi:hypothetical protein